jgi:hypothetical protein
MESSSLVEAAYGSRIQATLRDFADAWARCDIDALMDLVGEQPCYRTSGGLVFEGRAAVREGFGQMCKPASADEAALPAPPPPRFFGNMCITYWYLRLAADSPPVRGIDIITFDDDAKVISKDAYRKMR